MGRDVAWVLCENRYGQEQNYILLDYDKDSNECLIQDKDGGEKWIDRSEVTPTNKESKEILK